MSGILDFVAPPYNGKLANPGPTPTLSTTGLGVGGTTSIVGGNVAGIITVNAGVLPVAIGVLTVTYSAAMTKLPSSVLISSANGATIGNGYVDSYLDRFTISGLTILAATSYSFMYLVIDT